MRDWWTAIWINPERYGAVGDGVTDDTASFQRALDESRQLRLMSDPFDLSDMD